MKLVRIAFEVEKSKLNIPDLSEFGTAQTTHNECRLEAVTTGRRRTSYLYDVDGVDVSVSIVGEASY